MKKLLICSDTFLPRWDGISRFLSEVVPRLAKHYDITLIAPDYGEIKMDNVNLIRFPVVKFRLGEYPPPRPSMSKIKKAVKKSDIVWSQSLGPIGAASMYYAKKYKKPCTAYIHSIEWELYSKHITTSRHIQKLIHWITIRLAKRFYNKCSSLMIPYEDIRKTLEKLGISPISNIVPLAVDTDIFKPANNKREAKQNLGIDPESIVIGYVGRIGREKDIPTLEKAFRIVRKNKEGARLLIVGKGLELNNVLESQDKVISVGSQDNVVPYYQAMDIFVLPSLTETTSLATMEAMSCGLPVIVTKVGYLPKYIKSAYNGYFFPSQDPETLAKKIKKLIDNEELKKAIGGRARKTIISRYSWDSTVKTIIQVLDSM